MSGESCRMEHTIPRLESLLHKKLGKDLVLIEYTATSLLPPGENYGSLILKVDAKIRMGEEKDTRLLSLIAKIPPATQRQRDFFDSPFTFSKERFMYEEILPMYRKFEIECGVEDPCDFGPEFYGSRLSLTDDESFDDNAVILMEDLKTRGYYLADRYAGLDFDHAELAVRAMARFHALGIAMKSKRTEFFEVLKVRSKCLEMKNPDEWKDAMIEMHKNIREDPVLAEHYDKCIKAFETGSSTDCWFAPPKEPWSTIIHADFWTNNIMFHRNDLADKPDRVKFIDFQNYLFLSPTRELAFFIGSGTNHELGVPQGDLLIDRYYEELVYRLELMGCDTSPYSRDKFNEQLAKDAYLEFNHSAFMLKIMTKVVDIDDPDSRNVSNVMLNSCSEMFYVRLRDLVKGYIQRGWM